MYKRNNSWYSDFIYKGQRYKKSLGPVCKTVAKERDTTFRSEVSEGRYQKQTDNPLFETFMVQYLDYSKLNKKPKSYIRDVSSSKHLLRFFSGKRLSEVHSFLVERYKKQRQEQKAEVATINREVACLRNMFNKAIDWKKAKNNPITKKVKLFKENNKRMWVLSEEEEGSLFETIKSNSKTRHIEPIVIAGLHSGMRKGEIFNLKKDRIVFKIGYILVEDTKNSEIRKVPMNSILAETLRQAIKRSDSEYVFPGKNGNPLTDIKTAWWHVVKKAGLEQVENGKLIRFRFHDLRHTFGSRLIMNGVDLPTVAEIMGHKDIKMTMRYAHPTPEHKKRAVETLCEVTPKSTPVAKVANLTKAGNLDK